MKKYIALFPVRIKKIEKPQITYLLQKKTLVISIICRKCKNENEKLSKEEESTEILRILGLI